MQTALNQLLQNPRCDSPGADIHLYDIVQVQSTPLLHVIGERRAEHGTTDVLRLTRLVDDCKLTVNTIHRYQLAKYSRETSSHLYSNQTTRFIENTIKIK